MLPISGAGFTGTVVPICLESEAKTGFNPPPHRTQSANQNALAAKYKMSKPLSFTIASGDVVHFEQLHIAKHSLSGFGIMEGSYEGIRRGVVKLLQEEVEKNFGQAGFFLQELADGEELVRKNIPPFTLFVQLRGSSAKKGVGYSLLAAIFFADSMPENLTAELAARISAISAADWAKHATNQA